MSDVVLVCWSYVILQLIALAGWPWLAIVLGLRESGAAQLDKVPATASANAPSEGDLFSDRPVPCDLGFPLSKSLGLVLVSYATWLVGFIGIPVVPLVVWLVWAILVAVGLTAAGLSRATIAALWRKSRKAILAGEAVFLVVFLSLCHIRALTPDATFVRDELGRPYDESASEKFTNLALLTGLHRETQMPPRDSWLAGYPINYYYFGHFQWATFCKMSFIAPRVGFNISQAALFALIASNAFSLVLGLTRRIGAGLLAAYVVPFMGTPYGFMQLLLQGLKSYRYWDASRIVEGTLVNGQPSGPITEFPCFTFIVGDFHAHGISFHTYVVALAIAFLFPFDALRSSRKDWKRGGCGEDRSAGQAVASVAIATALLGVLLAVTVMTNTWDLPSLWLLIVAILVVKSFSSRAELRSADNAAATKRIPRSLAMTSLIAALVALVASVALLPHLTTFEMPVGAVRDPDAFYLIGPVKWLELKHLSEFKDYFVHFGFFLIPLTIAIHGRLIGRIRPIGPIEKAKQKRRRTAITIVGLAYLAALYVFLFAHRYFLLYYLSAMIVSALVLLVVELSNVLEKRTRTDRQERSIFAAVGSLSAVAFSLSLFAELWVVDDGYSGHLERYNTVFKTYNIAWLLYGLSSAAALWLLPRWSADWRGMLRIRFLAPWLAAASITAMGLAYPYAATVARVRELQWRTQFRGRVALPVGPALDAVRYYASVNRDEYTLVEWIADSIGGRPVVAEGCRDKDSYSLQSRIATFTGLPIVVAWPQHEANWRSYVPSPSPSPRGGGRFSSARREEARGRVEVEDESHAKVRIWDEMGRRIADLRALYTARDEQVIRAVIIRYRIDYIVIGRWERALYGADAGQHVRKLFKPVFESPSGDAVLLKTARESWVTAKLTMQN